jgi:hypothetical protein
LKKRSPKRAHQTSSSPGPPSALAGAGKHQTIDVWILMIGNCLVIDVW